jgi:DNA-directed RNA polymerase specialized sigma subunit
MASHSQRHSSIRKSESQNAIDPMNPHDMRHPKRGAASTNHDKTLTPAQQRDLILRWQAGDKVAMASLLSDLDSDVRKWARYVHRRTSKVEFEDLVAQSHLIIIALARDFDLDSGKPFLFVANYALKTLLLRYAIWNNETIRTPERIYYQSLSIERAREKLKQDLGRAPTADELSAATGVSHGTLSSIALRQLLRVNSLDEMIEQNADEDFVAAISEDTTELANSNETK